MKSWFFTATDTGVGKTTVTAASASALRTRGVNVGIMKPFATGAERKHGYRSEDVALLAEAAGIQDPEAMINPFFFAIESSPYGAANRLGFDIDMGLALRQFEILQSLHDTVLVEGIGGVLTPILKNYFVADLIRDMGLDTVIVASSKLGTVNHTLLTCDACKRRGIAVRGLVIIGAERGYDLEELGQDLENLSGIEVLCTLPFMKNLDLPKASGVVAESKLFDLISS